MLAFASRERLMSIHDGNWIADARAGTLGRSFLPWHSVPGTRNYHSFDVVISGGNPLLAAILLRRAVDMDLSAAVTLPCDPDEWPYDLSMTPGGGALVLAAAGIAPYAVDPSMPAARAVVRQMLEAAAGRACLLPGQGFLMSVKHPPGEVALYLSDGSACGTLPADQAALAEEFRSASIGLIAAECLPDRKTAVFARKLVLTSMPRSFTTTSVSAIGRLSKIEWGHPSVAASGTARTDAIDGASAARAMIDDVVGCSRALPFSGLKTQ